MYDTKEQEIKEYLRNSSSLRKNDKLNEWLDGIWISTFLFLW